VFFNEYGQWPEEFSMVANVKTSKRSYEEAMMVVAFGSTQVKPEGTGTTYEDLVDYAPIRATMVSRGLGFRVTREARDDEMYDIINQAPASLSRSVRQTREAVGISPLNNAFNASFPVIDGKALCAVDHPLKGGGTFSNKLSADLTATSLKAALIAADKWIDDRGMNIMVRMENLWVPSDLQWKAEEILRSSQMPYNWDNTVNVLRGKLTPHVLHYLTSLTAWFVGSSKNDHGICFYDRTSPTYENADDFDTGDEKYKTFHREAAIAWHHYGFIGSDGLGS
jgi:hypothetical protein